MATKPFLWCTPDANGGRLRLGPRILIMDSVDGGGLVGLGGRGGLGQPSTMVSVAMIRMPKVSRPRMFAND